jgi:hypothetical protein
VDEREKASLSQVAHPPPELSGSTDEGVVSTEIPVSAIQPATEGILAGEPKLKGANLFRQLAWKAVAAENAQYGLMAASPAHGPLGMAVPSERGKRRDGSHHLNPSRISELRPSLKKLQVADTIWDHTALVKHLQFSPDGKVLATCGWDGTARLFNVPTAAGAGIGRRNVMAIAGKSLGAVKFWEQAAWSPDGRWLLTKWKDGVQIWTEVCRLSFQYCEFDFMWNKQSGIRKHTIPRKMIRSVAWLPSSEGESWLGQYTRQTNLFVAFLSVEGSQVVKMSLDGVVRETIELDRLDMRDVAVTPDEERMLGVAILLSTKSGLQPSLSKAEKRIVGASIYISAPSKWHSSHLLL